MSQTEIWNDLVGDAWVRHAEIIDAHHSAFGGAAMDVLGPLDGATVLDVGCGTGSTSYELARRGAGAVVGIDLSETMVSHARSRAGATDGGRVRFEVGDVMHFKADQPFDAAFSRFGVMFFDDAVAGFAHLRSLVREGGRLGFASWCSPLVNPWLSLAIMASIPVLGAPALPAPGEPGPFSLSQPERVHEVLEAAGWRHVVVEERSVEAAHPAGDADAVAAVLIDDNPILAGGLARSPESADELHEAVAEALRPQESNGHVVLAAVALVTVATA